MLNAIEARNALQKQVLFGKPSQFIEGNLKATIIALRGLAFKLGTDDMREASSLMLIRGLLAAGAKVAAHDPVAMRPQRLSWVHRLRASALLKTRMRP